MKGKKALWLPGADHAGFETQVVFERKLKEKGETRLDMERKEFYDKVWDYTQKNRDLVRDQIKKLGASCDWSKDTFTLDEKVVNTTYKTFKKMADEGLIYRRKRLVNYCTNHETAFSDLEVDHVEQKSPLYYIKYGPFILATTRPETKFGDTAIAVHPDDRRYRKYVGKEIKIETLQGERKIKVIADEAVDRDFGTGAVKVTPAHSEVDFEIWQRHKDEMPEPIEVINKEGKMMAPAGPYKGMPVKKARKKLAEDLREAGLLQRIDEEYTNNLSVCYKCGKEIEPILMEQWFIDIEPLAKPAIEAVKDDEVKIVPENYKKVYLHWMENIKDWNISRQNWWGIPIPAWKCLDCSSDDDQEWIITEGEEPKKCPQCGGDNLERDGDVFDTWFSSGQWPFATLIDENNPELEKYYPTSVMETAYDILFFWVARMIMLGLYRTGEAPFKHVYLHGLVRDENRDKMSKSKGNVINPIEVADQYGTDALRMSLIIGNMPGKDSTISENEIKGYRNYINKLWNMFRFLMMRCDDYDPKEKVKLTKEDKKLVKEFEEKAKEITNHLDNFEFSHAAEKLYHYSWHRFADEIIEESKEVLDNEDKKAAREKVLFTVFSGILKLAHPFIPFVTEEIYQKMPLEDKKETLMIENWPR
jgi:valyl-tRNA synthetase